MQNIRRSKLISSVLNSPLVIVVTAGIVLMACERGLGPSAPSEDAPPAGYTFTVTADSLTIEPGRLATTTLIVTRTAGFTGAITFSAASSQSGFSAMIESASEPDTYLLSIAAAENVPIGSHRFSIKGTAVAQTDQEITLYVMVVNPSPNPLETGYRFALSTPYLIVQDGSPGLAVLTVNRQDGFAASVSVRAQASPSAMLTVELEVVDTNSYLVRVTANAATPSGPYEITITGESAAVAPQTVSLHVVVPGPEASGENRCLGRTVFLATQDGGGPWKTTGASDKVEWPSGRGALAFVWAYKVSDGTSTVPAFETHVYFGTRDELVALSRGCQVDGPTSRYIEGEIANGGADVKIAIGNGQARISGSRFALNAPAAGDLVAWNNSGLFGPDDKAIIRRNLSFAPGTTLPVLDFASPEAVPFKPRRLTIVGADVTEVNADYRTANGTYASLMCFSFSYNFDFCSVPNPTPYPSIPAPEPGDAHRLSLWAADRSVMVCSRFAEDRTLSLPAKLAGVNVTPVSSDNLRYRITYNRQPEYNGGVSIKFTNIHYFDASHFAFERITEIRVSGAYLGAGGVDVTMPDFSGLNGWSSNWGLIPGSNPQVTFEAYGWSAGTNSNSAPCSSGVALFSWMRPDAAEVRQARLTRSAH